MKYNSDITKPGDAIKSLPSPLLLLYPGKYNRHEWILEVNKSETSEIVQIMVKAWYVGMDGNKTITFTPNTTGTGL